MKNLAPLILIAVTFSVVAFTVNGHHGLRQLLRISEEVGLLEEQNRKLLLEVHELERKIAVAKESRFFLEQKAREELALSDPADIVYVLPK